MDKELERKIREEAAQYLWGGKYKELAFFAKEWVDYLFKFVIKMIEKYGTDNKST